MGWLRGAIAALAIALVPLPAHAMRFRLHVPPLATTVHTQDLHPDLASHPPDVQLPPWMDWAMRLVDGRAFTLAQPSWEGELSAPGSQWRLSLDAGLKGRYDLGFGPAVAAAGSLQWAPWTLDGQVTGLIGGGGFALVGEFNLGAHPMTLNLRAWEGPGSNPGGASAMLTLRQQF